MHSLCTSCLECFQATSPPLQVGYLGVPAPVLRSSLCLDDSRCKKVADAAAEAVDTNIARPALRPTPAVLSAGAGEVAAVLLQELTSSKASAEERAGWRSSRVTKHQGAEEEATYMTYLPLALLKCEESRFCT